MAVHDDAAGFWDAHYSRHPDVWSGAPNAVLVTARPATCVPGLRLTSAAAREPMGCGWQSRAGGSPA